MPATISQTLMRRAGRPLIWLLALALLAYGQSSVLVQLLGPTHRHDAALSAAPPGWLDRADAVFHDVRVWRAALRERLLPGQPAHVHAAGPQHVHPHPHPHPDAAHRAEASHVEAHAHAHAAYQRHHHAVHDTTVVSLDGPGGASASDAASVAGAGSASLPLALAPRWALPILARQGPTWSGHAPTRWTDAAVLPLEHPPRV